MARATTGPRFLVGTSGFSYAPWRGHFYPKELATEDMLKFYASVFGTVEINHSFYRMPTPTLLTGWRRQTPLRFRFALKAPQRITHHLRLKDAAEPAREFVRRADSLGEKLGPLLFQLPPHLRADRDRLDEFLRALPQGSEPVFEFRHASWFTEEVYDVLAANRAALCIADTESLTTPLVATAPFGYVRLRRDDYSPADLADWATKLKEITRWKRVYVFLKHDEAGKAPALASAFIGAL
jgi:uncharacterized protein YecE (DUF72 family)